MGDKFFGAAMRFICGVDTKADQIDRAVIVLLLSLAALVIFAFAMGVKTLI